MTLDDSPTIVVGPLRVAGSDVIISTNCDAFANLARTVFVDLATDSAGQEQRAIVEFETLCHHRPELTWAIRRDGKPCEMELSEAAVLIHQQWELNRLAIETQRAAVHAAAVAVHDSAMLIAGHSHSGKTTLAGWLAGRLGARYVADEVAAVDHRLRVRPFPRPLGLRPDGPLDGFPAGHEERLDELVQRYMPEERLVPISRLGGVAATEPVPIRLLVFPRFEPGSSVSIRAISRAAALERLVRLTPGVVRHGRSVFRRLADLVDSAPALEVCHGDVSVVGPELLAALTESSDRAPSGRAPSGPTPSGPASAGPAPD